MNGWTIEKVASERARKGFVWQVACPAQPPEPSWENDFLRGYRCDCRRFRTEGKALRYVERMQCGSILPIDVESSNQEPQSGVTGTILPTNIPTETEVK